MDDTSFVDKVKNIDSGYFLFFGVGGIVISVFMPLLAGTGNHFLFIISICIPIVSLISLGIGVIGAIKEKKKDDYKIVENMNLFQNEYDICVNKLGIRKSDIQLTLIEEGKYGIYVPIIQYLWIENNILNMFPMANYYLEHAISTTSKPDISELKLKSIPIDSILYFEEVGELRKYTTVSGGGTSLKGALLGYVIAEDVGAIIGSRESIVTNVVSDDDRRIELIYKNQEGQIENLEFEHDAYDVFKKLIPLKELRKVVGVNLAQKVNRVPNTEIVQTKDTKDKLIQLNEMRKEGLITDQEFVDQKKKILDSF